MALSYNIPFSPPDHAPVELWRQYYNCLEINNDFIALYRATLNPFAFKSRRRMKEVEKIKEEIWGKYQIELGKYLCDNFVTDFSLIKIPENLKRLHKLHMMKDNNERKD